VLSRTVAAGLLVVALAAAGCGGADPAPSGEASSSPATSESVDPRLALEEPEPPIITGSVSDADAVRYARFFLEKDYRYALESGWTDSLEVHSTCGERCADAASALSSYREDDLLVTVSGWRVSAVTLVDRDPATLSWVVRMRLQADEVVVTDTRGEEVARQEGADALVALRVAQKGPDTLLVRDWLARGEMPGLTADWDPLG
jgi:hypothetical protein